MEQAEKIKCYLREQEFRGKTSYTGKLKLPNGDEYWVNLYPPDDKSRSHVIYLKPVVHKGVPY